MYQLTKYYTSKCPSCKSLDPSLKILKEEGLAVFEINCEDVTEAFLSATGITGVPTVILSKDSKEISRFVGPKSLSAIRDWVEASKQGA